MNRFKRMHDVETATKSMNIILSHTNDKDKGAVPVPVDVAREALLALHLEKHLFELVRGFEVTKGRAIERATSAEQTAVEGQSELDANATNCAYDVLRTILNEYFRG